MRMLKQIIQWLAVLFFISLGIYFYIIQDVPLDRNLLLLTIGMLAIILLIEHGFHLLEKFQVQLDFKLRVTQRQSHRYAALAQLSTELATNLEEKVICYRLIRGLHRKFGYGHVGIFMVDKETGDRVMPPEGSIGWKDLPSNFRIPQGEGLSELPLLDGKLHYTPNVRKDPRYIPGLSKGAEVDVPLRVGDQILGVLVVESPKPESFTDDDFRVLTTAANQAAIAIYNARLLVKEKAENKQAEILRKATTALTSALDLDLVLDQLLIRLREVVPYDSSVVFLLEDGPAEDGSIYMNAVAARGIPIPEEVVGHQYPANNPLFRKSLSTARPVIIEDASKEKRFQRWGKSDSVHGWMGVPLIARGEVIGFLTLDSHQIGAYGENEEKLAQVFANQAAVAIDNAQLFESAHEATDRRTILHQVSQEIISASMEPERIYQSIHQAASQLMPTEAFIISILDRKREKINLLYFVDRDGRSPPKQIPKNQGLSGYVIGTGETLLVNQLTPETEQRYGVMQFGTSKDIHSFIAVPMRLGKDTFGMLSAQSYHTNMYKEEDKYLLEMLAAHAAIAFDNARLFQEVQRLAITDDLTGLHNRRHFFELADREFNRAKRYGHPLSAVMVDLDYFKLVNDSYGHATGDQVLRIIAHRCHDNIRETDILGRYGGEEFSIILPETTAEQAYEIAERLRVRIAEQPINIDKNTSLTITISLGICEKSSDINSLSNLLNHADAALYSAKQSGRNKVMIKS